MSDPRELEPLAPTVDAVADDLQHQEAPPSIGNGDAATHVATLPPDASAAGVRRLIAACSGGRLVLVVPGRLNGFERTAPAIFQVARRQADLQGLPVAVVTKHSLLRALASEAGLPVFSTVEGAQSARTWRAPAPAGDGRPPAPRRDPHEPVDQQRRGWLTARFRRVRIEEGLPPPIPGWLEAVGLAGLLVGLVAALIGLVAFVVPVATVRLVPALEPVTATVTVTARPDVTAPRAADRVVPARRIGERVEAVDTIETTGTRSAPDQPARGSVVFINRGPTPQEIPAGTVVSTSTGANVRFQTTEPAQLPPGVGARATVPIEALEPGPVGNVRAFTINTIEGPLALAANVINPAPTSGGSVKPVAVVTQADKDRLRSRLEPQLKQRAFSALGELLNEGEFVPPETVGTLVVSETYDRFNDEQAEQLTLGLRLLATALAVDGAAADQMALQELANSLPRRTRLLVDTVTYTRGPAQVTTLEDGTPVITFDVTASGQAVLDIDPAAVRALIRGLPPAEAVQKLQSEWWLQQPPELVLGPDWVQPILRRLDQDWLPMHVVDRVPWLPFRIHVRIDLARPG
ncbi:MAG: baseplate J/gp47 family protein [Caldilineales bacterium]|nr:baseplate J/gp47 family protein [Caldilineales bacterium]MDW8318652.1 baseplate J/gp47 family protein [Anaerolineae bacterium]